MTIWNRKWIVLLCVAVCLNAAVARYYFSTKIYTATAQVCVSSPAMAAGNLSSKEFLYREAELITKSPVLVIAARNPDPTEEPAATRPGEKPAPRVDLRKLKTFNGSASVIPLLQKDLHTSVGKDDLIINVSFDSPYPDEAAVVVNEVVKAYQAFHTDQRSLNNKKVEADLTPKRDEIEKEVRSQQDVRTAFLNKHKNVVDQGAALRKQLADAEDRWAAVDAEAKRAAMFYQEQLPALVADPAKREQLNEKGTIEGVMLPAVPQDQREAAVLQELTLAQDNFDRQSARWGVNHPAMPAIRIKLENAKSRYAVLLWQKKNEAELVAKGLGERRDQLKREEASVIAEAAEYEKLETDLKRNEGMLNKLEEQLKSAKVGADAPPITISVTEPAQAPTQPSKPDLKMLGFQGGLIGLALGLILSLADQKLRSVSEMMAAVNLPVLGVVPRMSGRLTLTSRGRKVHLDPSSDVAESFRQVRTAVFFGVPEERAKTILITSATRGDGKSTLASNLAIAMAEAGQHVLIVDADLREPMQHRIFSATADKGITSIVSGRATLDRAIQATAIKGLDILPCGPVPLNPAEIVNNQSFADVLDALAQRYDRVILDSPPVMPVTDARILAATCDVTILVLRAEKSTRGASADARDGLLGFGANLLGVVVNGASRRKGRYGVYGGYGLRRGQGHGVTAGRQIEGEEEANGTEMVVSKR